MASADQHFSGRDVLFSITHQMRRHVPLLPSFPFLVETLLEVGESDECAIFSPL